MTVGSSAVVVGPYRYRLERADPGGTGKTCAFIMVNPSTADHEKNDHTIRKLIGFSRRYALGRIIVGNKFAFRATDVHDLRDADDAVGPDNDKHLEQIMRDADTHIVAWGPLTKLPANLRPRWRQVVTIAARVGCRLHCLGTAQDGQPFHPLTLGYAEAPRPWSELFCHYRAGVRRSDP